MKPTLIPALVLAASLGVAAGSQVAPGPASSPAGPGDCAPPLATSGGPAPASTSASASLSVEDRAALRLAEQRDADLADVKAGLFLSDHDVVLVLGTAAVVVLIALLL